MTDADIEAAQGFVDEQAKWGQILDSHAIERLVRWAQRSEARLEELNARVKVLEDARPGASARRPQ